MALTRDPKLGNLPEVQPDGTVGPAVTVENTLWSTEIGRAHV